MPAAGQVRPSNGGCGSLDLGPDEYRVEADRGFPATLESARAGDESALTALYRGLHAKLLRYLIAYEPDQADDIASEVWLDVAAGLDEFEGDERDFRAWSFTIARRRLTDARRKSERVERRVAPIDSVRGRAGEGDDAPALAESDLAIRAALKRLAALPHEDAEVILLRVVGGFTAEEVAMLVQRPPATVRSRQQRAIGRLARADRSEQVA
jgi:RNA polymerase sigma-70 factor, ECF subfamily